VYLKVRETFLVSLIRSCARTLIRLLFRKALRYLSPRNSVEKSMSRKGSARMEKVSAAE
jgi:hypothetical protein